MNVKICFFLGRIQNFFSSLHVWLWSRNVWFSSLNYMWKPEFSSKMKSNYSEVSKTALVFWGIYNCHCTVLCTVILSQPNQTSAVWQDAFDWLEFNDNATYKDTLWYIFPLSFCDLVEALSCRLNRSASVKITALNAHCLGAYLKIYLSEISCIKATKDLFKNTTRLMVMSLFREQ